MTEILFGDRIGLKGIVRLGCSAVLFDEHRKKVLLPQRADNGQWCLPSGAFEPGESVAEAFERETWEETGIKVQVDRLTSNQFQFTTLNYEVREIGGKFNVSAETADIGFFSELKIKTMDIFPHHKQFILDTLTGQDAAFIR
jgi:8-oxo-dGTP pyrophosphatase MutT (NUDIX family)